MSDTIINVEPETVQAENKADDAVTQAVDIAEKIIDTAKELNESEENHTVRLLHDVITRLDEFKSRFDDLDARLLATESAAIDASISADIAADIAADVVDGIAEEVIDGIEPGPVEVIVSDEVVSDEVIEKQDAPVIDIVEAEPRPEKKKRARVWL